MIFLDSQCPTCNGHGCAKCHGTGMIGSVSGVDVPMPQPEPDSFGEHMRLWRLAHGRTFRELSAETGILPGTLSEIENGRREPTLNQIIKLEELMK